jgi:hypothetical protein
VQLRVEGFEPLPSGYEVSDAVTCLKALNPLAIQEGSDATTRPSTVDPPQWWAPVLTRVSCLSASRGQ